MPQSNVIFAFLFVAFLVFTTARGELQTYLSLLFKAGGTGGTQQLASAASTTAQAVGTVAAIAA